MPTPIEFNEARGSMENHLALLQQRIDDARRDYEEALSKGHTAQAETAKQALDQAQTDYDNFVDQNLPEQKAKAASVN